MVTELLTSLSLSLCVFQGAGAAICVWDNWKRRPQLTSPSPNLWICVPNFLCPSSAPRPLPLPCLSQQPPWPTQKYFSQSPSLNSLLSTAKCAYATLSATPTWPQPPPPRLPGTHKFTSIVFSPPSLLLPAAFVLNPASHHLLLLCLGWGTHKLAKETNPSSLPRALQRHTTLEAPS